ncbi:MAG: Na/Pi cotransporter family protein [Candidatus Diapherotrites archaeon]|nr:Na/Pi cotransporter family protein [Candidatus Diapherotrites archaeon]
MDLGPLIAPIFGILAGLAVFLFGMSMLSETLKSVAGEKLKKLLERFTNSRIKACAVGAFVTGILQSSSLMMVVFIGFLNAGMMSLEQAVWAMLGAEIGTTVTAQLLAGAVSFKLVDLLGMPFLAAGFFAQLMSRKKSFKSAGKIIFAVGLILLGMDLMSDAVGHIKKDPNAKDLLASFGTQPVLGVLAGAIFTAIVQSSSATTALVIAISTTGAITLPGAIAIILGANIGTTFDTHLAAIGSNISGKKLAFIQSTVNVLGAIAFIPFIYQFSAVMAATSNELPRQIANSHTTFNVVCTAVALPLSAYLVKISGRIIKGHDVRVERGLKHINKKIAAVPSVALAQIKKEVLRMSDIALEMIKISRKALLENDLSMKKQLYEYEDTLDELKLILFIMVEDLCKGELNCEDHRNAAMLKSHIIDIERVGDHANNLFELAEKKRELKTEFSTKEKKELNHYFELATEAYLAGAKALRCAEEVHYKKIIKNEQELDMIQERIEKIESKEKEKKSAIIMVEAFLNLERISDHAKNIMRTLQQGF